MTKPIEKDYENRSILAFMCAQPKEQLAPDSINELEQSEPTYIMASTDNRTIHKRPLRSVEDTDLLIQIDSPSYLPEMDGRMIKRVKSSVQTTNDTSQPATNTVSIANSTVPLTSFTGALIVKASVIPFEIVSSRIPTEIHYYTPKTNDSSTKFSNREEIHYYMSTYH